MDEVKAKEAEQKKAKAEAKVDRKVGGKNADVDEKEC